jgi:hypothetical protein
MRSQWGGKILDTVTRLHFSILASLRASSKEERYSLCLPTPLVKKTFDGTNDNGVSPDILMYCRKQGFIEKKIGNPEMPNCYEYVKSSKKSKSASTVIHYG